MSFNFINSYCLDCKKESKFFYEELSKLYDNDKALNLGSLNQILDKITCSSCNSNNLEIKDQNNELLFNPLYNISCKGEDCGLPIPFTRIKIEPNTDLCTVCKQNGEIVGFVAFCDNSITWLYVEPKFFRNGYGRMLLDFVLNRISSSFSYSSFSEL